MQLSSAEIHYRLIKKLPDCSEQRLIQAILSLHRSIPLLISEDVSKVYLTVSCISSFIVLCRLILSAVLVSRPDLFHLVLFFNIFTDFDCLILIHLFR